MLSYLSSLVEYAQEKLIGSAILVFCADFFGKDWWMIRTMFILVIIDFILGVIRGYKEDYKLSLVKLRNGFVKLVAYNLSVILVWLCQEIVTRSVGLDIPILGFFSGYQSLTELTSITRHLDSLGIKLPLLVKLIFVKYEKQIGSKIDQELDSSSRSTSGNCLSSNSKSEQQS